MNKLLIIGNGFDLAHGLKTRYSDFLVWYLDSVLERFKREYKYEDELIVIHEVLIKLPSIKIENLEQFQKHLQEFPEIRLKHNSDFFKDLIQRANDKNWVDIESEYYRKLVKMFKDAEKNDFNYWETEFKAISNFNNKFAFIKTLFFRYLESLPVNDGIINSSIETNLEQIIYDPDCELSEKNKDDSVRILNFNYTSTLDLYVNSLKIDLPYEVISIHGNIKQGLDSIIFGYGDEMDPYYQKLENLNSNELLKNIKSFGYLKNGNYQKFRLFTDKGKFKVYILGHSCGLSDRILLNSIFEHKNCESIEIFYHKRSAVDNDYTEKTMEISRHFGPQNKDKMRTIIVPFDKCRPLT